MLHQSVHHHPPKQKAKVELIPDIAIYIKEDLHPTLDFMHETNSVDHYKVAYDTTKLIQIASSTKKKLESDKSNCC